MHNFSNSARLYLLVVWGCGAGILIMLTPLLTLQTDFFWYAIWLVSYALADYFEVTFESSNNQVGMTLAETATIFLVAVGNFSSVYVIALATLCVEIVRRRIWYKAFFNIACRIITTTLIVIVFNLFSLPNSIPFSDLRGIIAFTCISMTFYLSSATLVGIIVAFSTGAPIQSVYRDSYKLVQWIHLLTLPIGALMAVHWNTNRWLLVFDIIILLIAQRSFALVAQLQAEGQRTKVLADERAALLEELKARQDDLIRASKLTSLGTFAAGIAHEFNNLLQVIDGNAALGAMTDDKDEMRYCLELIAKTSRRGSSITNGLLTFGRQGEMRRMMIQLDDVVADVLDIIVPELRKDHVDVVRQIEPVPATYADPGQLMQVLLNMLGNARDAMRERGGSITLGLRAEDSQIVISIADTGIGMSPETQRDLFQPFMTTKGVQGTGLGLAICYGIIEQHSGSINVISTLGDGTTMVIRLPIVERNEPAIRLSLEDTIRLEAATSHEPARIY